MQALRIFFTKKGEAAYISHLDLQRVMARALRKSRLPVWYSQGFNPHIYMSFALPLPLGQESEAESVDCKTEAEGADFSAFLGSLNGALPKGITAQSIALPKHKPAEICAAVYRIEYEGAGEQLPKTLEAFAALSQAPVIQKRKKTTETVDLRRLVQGLTPAENEAFLAIFPAGSEQNLNPFLFTGFLEETFKLPRNAAKILRQKVLLQNGEEFC